MINFKYKIQYHLNASSFNCHIYMSKILFFDTETTGLPETRGWGNYYEPMYTGYYDCARMIELAYVICDADKQIIKSVNYIIRPNGFVINNSEFHGITMDDANEFGININDVLQEFKSDLSGVDLVVGHNINFDLHIIMSECYRTNDDNFVELAVNLKKMSKACTMEVGKAYMQGQKFPKLVELYSYLFNKPIEQEHRALSDTRICVDCYYKMNP